jgi:hypothetical protein
MELEIEMFSSHLVKGEISSGYIMFLFQVPLHNWVSGSSALVARRVLTLHGFRTT